MEYKPQQPSQPKVTPRIIIHGGAGNLRPSTIPPEKRRAYREALFTIVRFLFPSRTAQPHTRTQLANPAHR